MLLFVFFCFSCFVCFRYVRFSFFGTTLRDWLEERLRNDLFYVELDKKNLNSVSQNSQLPGKTVLARKCLDECEGTGGPRQSNSAGNRPVSWEWRERSPQEPAQHLQMTTVCSWLYKHANVEFFLEIKFSLKWNKRDREKKDGEVMVT